MFDFQRKNNPSSTFFIKNKNELLTGKEIRGYSSDIISISFIV